MNATQTETVELETGGAVGAPSSSAPGSLNWAVPRKRWLVAVVVISAIVLLGFGLRALVGDVAKRDNSFIYYTVKRGDLPIVVTERGNLASQVTEEIMCEVENFGDRMGSSGTQILFIVANGCSVKKGDLLVELDSAPLKERLDTQFLALQRADAEMVQAQVKHENQITQNETALAEAQLRLELADLALKMYQDEEGGTFQIEVQNVEMEIQKAQAERLINYTNLQAVQTLYGLGYKSKGDKASAELALLKSDAKLASTLAQLRQLTKYTYEMEIKDLKGKFATADRTLKQVGRNNTALLSQAKAAKESAESAYDKEKERYERYKEQLEKCKIVAPQDGMVAYATGEGRYNRGTTIEEGAFIRQRQKILTLPSLSKMQVSTAVHESVLDQVKVGLPASIKVESFPDRSYSGKVESVAVLPDPGGWLNSDTKVYKTIVTIDEEVTQLKPGMSAVVEIRVERLKNIISVPIQAVVQRGDENWCYVETRGNIQKRQVTLGKTNDKFVEIKEGLTVGETVVLNPSSIVELEETREKKSEKDGKSADDPAEADPVGPGKQLPGPPGATRGGGKKTAPRGESARGTSGGGGKRGKMSGKRGGFSFAQLDANKDGKITKEELPEGARGMFDRMDKNQDGVLDAAELRSRSGMRNRSGGAPGGKKRPGQ